MTTKTLRLPDMLTDAVREVGRYEHIEEATAMRKLLSMGYEVYLAELYRRGTVSIRDVAARLDVSITEALAKLQQVGISGNVSADDTLRSLKSLA